MRTAAATTALGITLSIAALASCASPGPGESPGPSPSVTPVFASEEEALAAAENAYQRYLDVSNAIAQAGWVDTDAYRTVLRSDALAEEDESAADFRSRGWVQVGSSFFDSLTIQQLEDEGAGGVIISVYLCLDVSGVDVVDASGASVVSNSRPVRQALEVELDDLDGELLIGRSEAWSGANFC